jgi:nicotinamide-nucleotide amidase
MNAEIVSVGTELLLGQITDTNATFLTRELAALGINCFWVSQVGDNFARLRETLARAWGRSDLTIVTGGVGPTEDDLTREAIAAVLGEEMAVIPELEAELRAFFTARGVPMPATNLKQASRIPSAQTLRNPVGTAPGWWVERDGRIVVCMPGVPHEMTRMWSQEVAPRLAGAGAQIVSRTLKVLGLGESLAEDMVRDLLHQDNPTLATYAKNDGVHLRLTARAADAAAARALLAPLEAAVRARLGDAIWGADEDTLEDVICAALAERGLRLAVVEAGGASGGQIGRLLSGAARPAPVVAALTVPTLDSGALRNAGLHVDVDPLVGDEGVRALATAAQTRWGVDLALATAGILPEAAEGGRAQGAMWLGLAGASGVEALRLPIRAARGEVPRLMALAALNLLRKRLLERTGAPGPR